MHGNSTWNITTEQNERLHSVQRRLVSKAYSLDSLKTLESFVDHTVDHFLTRLRGYAGQVINLGDWLQLFAIGKLLESETRLTWFKAHCGGAIRHGGRSDLL